MRVVSGPTGVPAGVPRFLLAHLGWILLVAFVVTAAAGAFSWSRTPMYRTEADVLVAPRLLSETTAPQPPDMGTEKAIVSSGVVIAAASAALLIPAEALSEGLSVDVPVDTNVLKVQYTHVDPREARRRAQGVANAYVAFHAQQRPPRQADTAATDGGRTAASLVGMVQGVIITPAGVPREPATPNHPVDLAVALIVGLALGLGTAVVRDRLDDRLRGTADLENQSGQPVLAAIPAFRAPRRDPAAQLVMVSRPDSRAATAYRDLRTRVCQAAIQRGARIVLVADVAGRERTVVAANLAVAVARSGRSVVFVCADLRRPRAHALFRLDDGTGFSDLMAAGGALPLPLPVRRTDVAHLGLLPAGQARTDPGAVLQSPALPRLFDELTRSGDLVVVGAPPVLGGPDAAVLADLADLVVLVADFRRVTRAQVRAAVAELKPARSKLIGCVLDNVGLRMPLLRRSAPPPAPDAGAASPRDNGRYVGRVPATVTSEQPVLAQEEQAPN